ncbi:MAG: type II toxin-antitoxin system VapC family toxin [Gammaproteobacteria bacterium]
MIFIDSNIPMYLIGASHPLKFEARRLIESCIADSQRLVTSAEVFQEILHRYTAIGRRDAIQPAFDTMRGVVDEIFAIQATDVERAKAILLASERFSARDAT